MNLSFATWERRDKNHLQDVGQEREKFIHSLLSMFAFVKRFMKYIAKVHLIVPSSKLPAITISGLQRTKSCHVTLSLAKGESVSGSTIKNIIKVLVKLYCIMRKVKRAIP